MDPPPDQGLEGNVEMWRKAEGVLKSLVETRGQDGNDALTVALVDCHNRLIEERRRAGELLKLRRVWDARPVGGVVEPRELAVWDAPAE